MKQVLSQRSQYQQGFTLLEAMVAMVVFSVGLLGLGALQMAGMTNTQSALYQSVATHLAYDMADRIRSNPNGKNAGEYDDITGPPSGSTTLCKTGCTSKEVALRDHVEWSNDLQALLPAGQGRILGDGTDFTITVMWDAARNGATGTGCNPTVATDLKCLRILVRP
jgi:type IV pilus assembly protein PilV